MNEKDTGGYAAFVMTSQNPANGTDVIEMQFDLPDFSAPHTQCFPADRVVAREMVHASEAQNSRIGDIVGMAPIAENGSRKDWPNSFMLMPACFILASNGTTTQP